MNINYNKMNFKKNIHLWLAFAAVACFLKRQWALLWYWPGRANFNVCFDFWLLQARLDCSFPLGFDLSLSHSLHIVMNHRFKFHCLSSHCPPCSAVLGPLKESFHRNHIKTNQQSFQLSIPTPLKITCIMRSYICTWVFGPFKCQKHIRKNVDKCTT